MIDAATARITLAKVLIDVQHLSGSRCRQRIEFPHDVCYGVLDPVLPELNGADIATGNDNRGGVHGTWFWVDPANHAIVVDMVHRQDAVSAMT